MVSVAAPRDPRSGCDLLIGGGRLLDLDAAAGVLDGASIAVLDGMIVAVGPRQDVEAVWAPARRIDATDQVIAPGFVDAHVHLGAFLGAGGQPYAAATGPGPFSGAGRPEVVLPMVARMCSMPVPDELVTAVVRPVLMSMLRSGITSVVDAGSPGVDGLVVAAHELGIRAAIGPSLADLWHDEHGVLVQQADPESLLADAARAIDHYDTGDGCVRPVVSGVETMACSDELLTGIAALTAARNIPTHVHTHISDNSVRAHDAAFGRTATQRLTDAGMLTPRCTAMHAGSLTDADIAAFTAAGVTVNHNPVGNAMLGFGITAGGSVPRLLAAGVPVALGSDYAPSAISTPFEMIRATLMLHRDIAALDNAITLEQALAMATGNAGATLGLPGQIGRIAPGQLADLILVDITGPHHLATDHPIPALALHARASDVTTVIVGGYVIVERGQLVGVDEPALAASARQAYRKLAAHP